jgi:hypothetical protein
LTGIKKDLYLDCEWHVNQNVFLVGYVHSSTDCLGKPAQLLSKGQLYDSTLTQNNLLNLLHGTRYIFFYGPDIGMLEKHFNISIRQQYQCINLLKIFRYALPGLPSYKLADIEELYKIKRSDRKYKSNIFQALRDWNIPHKRKQVLRYNMEDTVNLFILKEKIFAKQKLNSDFLQHHLLSGIDGDVSLSESHLYQFILHTDYSKWFPKFY